MTIMNTLRTVWLALGLLAMSLPVLAAASPDADTSAEPDAPIELDEVTVEGRAESDPTSQDTDALRRGAANDTLGSYLDAMPNVDSASYGEGVGRPVVRGMTGYRVKILQNDHEVSDLSAMSQDHAVAVAPRTSERIELLKGPASLLYAAQSGGVIRVSDRLDSLFRERGFSGALSNDLRAGQSSQSSNGFAHFANDRYAAFVSGFRQASDAYESGAGDIVADSDLDTQQGQFGLGWRPGPRSEVQVSGTFLAKEYGIPNDTDTVSRIEGLERQDFTGAFSFFPGLSWLSTVRLDLLSSDYTHFETEGARQDGRFGLSRVNGALTLEWAGGPWTGRTRIDVGDSELQVCHEHDACEEFTTAERTGRPLGESMVQQFENNGFAFSHGHPLPDTDNQSAQLSTVIERAIWTGHDISLAVNTRVRELAPDPANIQEEWVHAEQLDPDHYRRQDDHTVSLAAGMSDRLIRERFGWEVSISYLERLPSVDELYWNGVHHATNTYLFGDVDLATERSMNLDLDLTFADGPHRARLSTFHYRFSDYIFQEQGFDANGTPLRDPFHLSDVWFTRQADADFTGASLRYDHLLGPRFRLPLTVWGEVEALSAEEAGGDNLPRTSPGNAALGVIYDTARWQATASVRRVFEARQLAPNETPTEGYTWISTYVQTTRNIGGYDLDFWLRGDNLLNAEARNHLSVLKATAPRPGRQVFAGINWRF